MSIGESHEELPRISSTFTRTMYHEIEQIANNVDFRLPVFEGRHKRNRSLGSTVAFITELALSDDAFLEKLKKYMVEDGRYWISSPYRGDKYE